MAYQFICSIPECGKSIKCKGLCRSHYARLLRHGDALGGRTAIGEAMRFIEETALTHEGNECLPWPFARTGSGYGVIWIDGQNESAHRYICTRAKGPAPTSEHEAAHSCGNGHEGCISPHHLEWKTHSGNMQDKAIHGTHNRGERHKMVKLTENNVREIREIRGALSQREIARRFGVGQAAIKDIQLRRTWAWLPD